MKRISVQLEDVEKDQLAREARLNARSTSAEAALRLRRSLNGALAGRDQAQDSETAVGERLSRGSVVGSRSVPGASTPAPRPASAPEPQEPEVDAASSPPPPGSGALSPAAASRQASPRPAVTEPGSDALARVLARPDVTTAAEVQAKPFSKADQAEGKRR